MQKKVDEGWINDRIHLEQTQHSHLKLRECKRALSHTRPGRWGLQKY